MQQEVQQPAFADLGNYRIPVPSLLSRSDAPVAELAFVPVPSRRPADAPAEPVIATVPAPTLRPTVEPQPVAVAQVPANSGTFRPSTNVMMGGTEPLRAPATIRSEAARPAQPLSAPQAAAASQPVAQPPVTAVAMAGPAIKVAKAPRVTPPAPAVVPVKEEPRTVPVYGFDPKRF
jgi:DNA polymerase-3 subunit gamma/tau